MNWADTNRHAVAPVPYNVAKVTEWCITGTFVLTIVLLCGSDTTGVYNVFCDRLSVYIHVANYGILELLQRNTLNDIVWMQDGASFHIEKSVRIIL